MKRLAGAGLCVLFAFAGAARAEVAAQDAWVQVRSPHFTVVSDAPAAEARGVALRFERVRAVFQKAFPGMRVYPNLPIVILAVRGKAAFQSLEPAAWLRQGEVERTGMMLRDPDKNFILLLLGAPGENPYHVVYHEYAHLVLEDDYRNIPLWLDEGLAEFYGNSEIDRKNVRLGLPSKTDLDLLRTRRLLPLRTLFTVDHTSPYYNEQNKGTMFYAEAWALTDYLMFSTPVAQKGPIDNYLRLVAAGTGPVAAATEAFGNLDQLQASLQAYVARSAFGYYRLKVSDPGGQDSYRVEPLSPAQSEAVRGDFMARTGSLEPARKLLQDALERDPQLSYAGQSMGLVELHEGHGSQAADWFMKAALNCSQCELARFYNAMALMQHDPGDAERSSIETAIEGFIHFNPTYAPAFAALARFEAASGGSLSKARDLAGRASQLDPHEIRYLFLEAEIIMKTGDTHSALGVAHQAVSEAQSPQEKSQAYIFLGTLQERVEAGGDKKQ
ncbi:MAG: hypothetical protein ACRD18_11705 [Terriglobia bacterium]